MAPNDLAVQAIATSALPACTYNNGTAGVGATLTASSNGAFPAVDGYTASLNDALAINGQSTVTQNGLYTLTTVGNGSTPWVLTRRSPDDSTIWTNPFCVLSGDIYANTVWCAQAIASNVGSDSINFAQQDNWQVDSFGITIDGNGYDPGTGSKGYITLPYSGTITNWYLAADTSGSCVIDVKRSGTSIVGAGNKPTLSSAQSGNAAVSGWTSTTVSAGDIIEFNLNSITTITRVNLMIQLLRT